ncbi:hypothetical protein B0H13DRAFT_595919 [Mycena leptocephala]|nr:hypothetical protein B0H13DRAFT_595919 [Mycena leptocephala]
MNLPHSQLAEKVPLSSLLSSPTEPGPDATPQSRHCPPLWWTRQPPPPSLVNNGPHWNGAIDPSLLGGAVQDFGTSRGMVRTASNSCLAPTSTLIPRPILDSAELRSVTTPSSATIAVLGSNSTISYSMPTGHSSDSALPVNLRGQKRKIDFASSARLVIPRLIGPTLNPPAWRLPDHQTLAWDKLHAISSSPSMRPYDMMVAPIPIPPRSLWCPNELEYVGPHHWTAQNWTDTAILEYMVLNGFTVPSHSAEKMWVELTSGMFTKTVVPYGYRILLLWLGKTQWDCLKLLLTSAREYWDHLKWDVLHIARLSGEFLAGARRQVNMKPDYRDAAFDRAMSRFFKGWMGSRDGFVWDFYREFRDTEYEDDILQREWLPKVVNGIQSFAITDTELNNGITADQFMKGLVFDRENGSFDWIGGDGLDPPAPTRSTLTVETAPVQASWGLMQVVPALALDSPTARQQEVDEILHTQGQKKEINNASSTENTSPLHDSAPSPMLEDILLPVPMPPVVRPNPMPKEHDRHSTPPPITVDAGSTPDPTASGDISVELSVQNCGLHEKQGDRLAETLSYQMTPYLCHLPCKKWYLSPYNPKVRPTRANNSQLRLPSRWMWILQWSHLWQPTLR